MKIWINNITGDVRIINALNHYIGMKLIELDMFPEFKYMIYILGGLIGFGILTSLVGKRFMLWAYLGLLVATAVAALVDFYLWGYDYGHNLNPEAAIQVPGMSYQPPLIGTKQLLNFTAYSGPDIGGWIFVASGALVAITIYFGTIRIRKKEGILDLIVMRLVFIPLLMLLPAKLSQTLCIMERTPATPAR